MLIKVDYKNITLSRLCYYIYIYIYIITESRQGHNVLSIYIYIWIAYYDIYSISRFMRVHIYLQLHVRISYRLLNKWHEFFSLCFIFDIFPLIKDYNDLMAFSRQRVLLYPK